MPQSLAYGVGAGDGTKLAKQRLDVEFDGVLGDAEPARRGLEIGRGSAPGGVSAIGQMGRFGTGRKSRGWLSSAPASPEGIPGR